MEDKKRVFTVLAIDGGGVRGLIAARILQEIEERTGKPIAELFDLLGGTSTGGIIAAGCVVPDPDEPTKPKYTAEEIKTAYFRDAPKIFPVMRFKSIRKLANGTLYDPKPLEESLQKQFGDLKMKDSLTHLMIPATDIKNFRPVWIKHIKGEKDTSAEGWSSMLLRDAVRATTTAPTYFPAKYYQTTPNEDMPNVTHRHALIDGGFFGGTLLRRLHSQAKKIAPPDAEIVVVHVGTGNVENSLSPEEYNRLGPLGLVSKSNGSLLLSLVIDMTIMDVANDIREEIGDRFISLDGTIDPEEDKNAPSNSLDDASDENLKLLEKFAERIVQDNTTEIDRLCDILKNNLIAKGMQQESQKALQELTERLESAKTVKTLTRLYRKVLLYTSGIDNEKSGQTDSSLKDLSQKLTEKHKGDLDRIYNVLQDKLENQSRLLNSLKEAGDDLTSITKKIFTNPFKPETPPPTDGQNDNKPTPPHSDVRRKFKP